jgi:hypothetical protein
VAGRFVNLPALLLEVLPDASGRLPAAFPLRFTDADEEEEIFRLSYSWDNEEWLITIDAASTASTVSDAGEEFIKAGGGVLFSEEGGALGLAFGERIPLGIGSEYWLGAQVSANPVIPAGEANEVEGLLNRYVGQAVLETRFHLRRQVEDDEEEPPWQIGGKLDGAEARAAGLAVGKRRLLVPVPLSADGVAHIEGISVVRGDGSEIQARFVGAFRDYMAVLLEADADLLPDGPPPGFLLLDPLADNPLPSDKVPGPAWGYFYRRRVDYSLGRRRETRDYDRCRGMLGGFRGDPVLFTWSNEMDGALAFDIEGNLMALALTPRLPPAFGNAAATAGFRPLAFLALNLRRPGFLDPAIQPIAEEVGRRLIDFGVEYQTLDANAAKLFSASNETRGGRIGLLITHVYPGFPAARIGLREHDILLRMFIEGRGEPVDLLDDGEGWLPSLTLDWAPESLEETLSIPGQPWPPRNNVISNLLTSAGAGRRIEVEYLREGELRRASFAAEYGEPDFQSARPEKFPGIGIDVKPVTYEAARYFRRPDSSGVLVSRVRDGSRAEIAGLCPYLVITRVDGVRVEDPADFRAKVSDFEAGRTASAEFTVAFFGLTRLIRLK